MPGQPEINEAAATRLLRRAFTDPAATVRPMAVAGQDGDKFDVTLSDGRHLFVKIRTQHNDNVPFQEDEILSQVNSPMVARSESLRVGRRHIIFSPFVDGENLEEHVRAHGTLSGERLSALATALLTSAGALHQVGAVHFDIKPQNIMVATDGTFHLVDFGAARFVGRITQERLRPARRFIAPEVLRLLQDPTDLNRMHVSALADMYGIGAVLYVAATGTCIDGITQSSEEVYQKNPPPVRGVRLTLDERTAALIEAMLSKVPADRPNAELALRILGGEPLREATLPVFFLKTKQRGEHNQMLPAILDNQPNVGIYWTGPSAPRFDDDGLLRSLMWELPHGTLVEDALAAQHERGTVVLTVSCEEIIPPLDAATLQHIQERIQAGLAWKNERASHRKLYAVLPVAVELFASPQQNTLRDMLAALNVDGIVLRVCAPNYNYVLTGEQLLAIRRFIGPWTGRVLLDAGLAALPMRLYGVSSMIATTYPKLEVLSTQRQPTPYARRADGLYVSPALSIMKDDDVLLLRTRQFLQYLTNCQCDGCRELVTGNHQAWTRPERRRHFLRKMPEDLASVGHGMSPQTFLDWVRQAQIEGRRFQAYQVRVNQNHLPQWEILLAV